MRARAVPVALAAVLALANIACGDSDPASSTTTPATHTILKGSARHAPGLTSPQQNCVSCHGADLRGSGEAPSCYSCHGKKWT